jgi:hypothetical protein
MGVREWYEPCPLDDGIEQGEVILGCPVYSMHLNGAGKVLITPATADVIVLTQTCDITERKVRNVLLGTIMKIDDYEAKWKTHMESTGQRPSPRAWEKELEGIRDGARPQYTLLNPCKVQNGPTITQRVINFSQTYALPLETIHDVARSISSGQRVRLISPYREYVAIRFAIYFMRPALPEPVIAFIKDGSAGAPAL